MDHFTKAIYVIVVRQVKIYMISSTSYLLAKTRKIWKCKKNSSVPVWRLKHQKSYDLIDADPHISLHFKDHNPTKSWRSGYFLNSLTRNYFPWKQSY